MSNHWPLTICCICVPVQAYHQEYFTKMTSTADAPGGKPNVGWFVLAQLDEWVPTNFVRKKEMEHTEKNLAVGDLVFLAD